MISRNCILAFACSFTLLLACKHKGRNFGNDTITTDNSNIIRADSIPAMQLIVPGRSIGQTTLDEAGSKMFNNLGKPDSSDAAMGKSVAVWYEEHNKKSYSTHIYLSTNMGNDDTSRVKAIRVSSPSFKINSKLYVGMLLADAEKQYKLIKLGTFTHNGTDYIIYDDTATGIAFDTDESGNITGITVHELDKSVLNAYTAFFNNTKADKQ